ncbi:MAG: SH3 domain-containing protein [Chloroflexota bacterium]|nr:SH3 domain-containing protein [Chloroflexota bacterium]
MKFKLIAVTIALCFLTSLAWAQDYSIRTEANTNLRSGPGLDRDWVETAPAGAILQVTGRRGRWLKINRNGRELWMASWLRHSRVHDGQPASAAGADIDNCCFLDRQCRSQEEWESGYWAFQNKQCGAQPVPASPQTPASQDAPGVDNCCFIGMHCASDQDWQRGYLAFQRNQCKHPDVHIIGGARFVAQVQAALDLLKARAPAWYAYTIKELKTINEVPAGIVGVDVNQRVFHLPPNHAFLHNNANLDDALVWLAGVLVHEACHIYRDKEGWAYGTAFERFREEVFCQTVQIQALDVFDPRKRFHDYLRRLIDDFYSRGYQL